MAIAYLNHTPIGKGTQAQPYTAAAHMRYITRRQATNYVYSERMPVQYHAAQRFMSEREDAIRKNGRVCDKFIIALPREMTMEQGVDALRDFGFRLSQGRAPFLFSIQDFNTENPHAHFVYVDADVSDGKRVFRTTDRDSTERIKKVWADTCNEHLLQLGRDERIEFGKAEEVSNDNDPPLEPVNPDHFVEVHELADAPESTQTPTAEDADSDLTLSDEEEEFDVAKAYVDYGAVERHERIRAALEAKTEWEFLRDQRNELARLQEMVARAERAALDRHTEFNLAAYNQAMVGMGVDAARKSVEAAPKGLHIKLGRWEWKSAGRLQREQAESSYAASQFAMQAAAQKTAEENLAAKIAAREAIELDERRRAVEFHLRTRGTTKELIEAEQIFENTVAHNMAGVSVDDVFAEMEADNISPEEARRTLILMGRESSWDLYEEMNGVEQEL